MSDVMMELLVLVNSLVRVTAGTHLTAEAALAKKRAADAEGRTLTVADLEAGEAEARAALQAIRDTKPPGA